MTAEINGTFSTDLQNLKAAVFRRNASLTIIVSNLLESLKSSWHMQKKNKASAANLFFSGMEVLLYEK